MTETPDVFDHFAILELMGHARLAGRVTEQTIGGHAFIRVDVPAIEGQPGFTRYLGPGAIYSLTLVTEAIARAALTALRPAAVTVYLPPQLPAPPPFAPRHPAYRDLNDDDTFDDTHEGDDDDRTTL